MGFNSYYEEEIEKQDLSQDPPENEPQRQYWYMKKCRQYVDALAEKLGRRPSACTVTMGCQMNIVHGI